MSERKDSISNDVENTLKFVNDIRIERGKEPIKKLPKGYRQNGRMCPISTALKDCGRDVLTAKRNVFIGAEVIDMPICAQNFVHSFDHGYLPKLDRNVIFGIRIRRDL